MRLWIVFFVFVTTACATHTPEPSPAPEPAVNEPTPDDPTAAADTTSKSETPREDEVHNGLPSGWPWAMLSLEGRPVHRIEDRQYPPELLDTHAVRSVHIFEASNPAVLLIVCEFESGTAAGNAAAPLIEWGSEHGLPYNADFVTNGAYLLIAGFSSHKPMSPQMEQGRDDLIQSFAGQE